MCKYIYIYIRAAYQKWRLTWSGIESMCVKAVAQPNGLLFRNSHFQDTMGCCYTLITSLPEPLKRQAVQSQLVLCTNMISYKESGTASPARRTPCVQVKVELGAYAVEQYGRITLCTQQGFGTGNLQLLFLEQIKKVHKKKKKKKKKNGARRACQKKCFTGGAGNV